jgi:hypothetical protein
MSSKKNKILVFIIVLASLISFILGIYTLRSGLLRKIYDIFQATINFRTFQMPNEHKYKLDTLHLKFSKKDLKKINKEFNNNYLKIENFVNFNYQWTNEREWHKIKTSFNNNSFIECEIKMIGMNTDHFREPNNISYRLKLKDEDYYLKYKKINLLNPLSRGYIVDYFFNSIYKNNQGLEIKSTPIMLEIDNNFKVKIFEVFFSKELLENQGRRDGIIFSADSLNVQTKTRHLKLIHPNNLTKLSTNQENIFSFYGESYQNKNLINFVNNEALVSFVALSILAGSNHHLVPINLTYYAESISGTLIPFMREIEVFDKIELLKIGTKKIDYKKRKKEVYEILGINDKFLKNNVNFDKLVDNFFFEISNIKIEDYINNNLDLQNLYFYLQKQYPWSFNYKNKILNSADFLNAPLKKESYLQNKNIVNLEGNILLKDTLIEFDDQTIVNIKPNTNLTLINSTLIFKNNVIAIGSAKNTISVRGDSLSSLLFTSGGEVNMHFVHFSGFGNQINKKQKNRDLTGGITFSENNVKMNNCIFSKNYLGDDFINFYRCKLMLDNINVFSALYDAIDIDYCTGTINNLSVKEAGNDGIDFAGSKINLLNSNFTYCMDKGISIGENSFLKVENIRVEKNEIGIALKDESILNLRNTQFKNNQIDFVGFSKKAQFGNSTAIFNNKNNDNIKYLIEPGVIIKPVNMLQIRSLNVIDSLYGKIYGRESIR